MWRQPTSCRDQFPEPRFSDALVVASSPAGRGERHTLGLGAPRDRSQHLHELSHRAEIFQIGDSIDRRCDCRGAQHAVRIGAELALDLTPRERVLGRAARMLAVRLERGVLHLDFGRRLDAAERRVGTQLDLTAAV